MKKNVMMRLASFLLIAVLISTSAISGTYAKYVTKGEAKDTARVAKFGVEVSANYSTLFTQTYTTHTAWAGDDGVSVNATADVVAPGTNGTLADFTVTGTPEVDVNVSYTVDLELGDKWMVDTDGDGTVESEYCPIVITVNNTSYCIDGTKIKTVAEFETAVENAIAESAKNYNAGTNLGDANAVANDLSVSWNWYFEGANEGGNGPACQWNKFDTQLGNAAADNEAATISLEVTCTVTQID